MSGGAKAIIDFPFRSRCALSIPRRKLSALIISRHGTIYILIIHHVFPTFMGPGNEFFKSLWPFLLRRAITHLDAWWKLIFSIFFFSHVLTIKRRIKGIRFSWLVNNGYVFLFIFGWVYFFTSTCHQASFGAYTHTVLLNMRLVHCYLRRSDSLLIFAQ
jgi:hypothetical protein